MPTAAVLLRSGPEYRREAFVQGLKAQGYKVSFEQDPGPNNLLLIWNRYGFFNSVARSYEQLGGKVLVAENGWIGRDVSGHKIYAVCRDQHNGAGSWNVGPPGRWESFGVELQPWRKDGRHILILPQRGIGSPTVRMPLNWTEDVVRRLKAVTDRPIKIRHHPGQEKSDPDFTSAWAAVTWASGAGIKAIAGGVPVFYELKDWIGAPAAVEGISNIEKPFLEDRLPMFERLAWAQWTLDEIKNGDPFRWLCG